MHYRRLAPFSLWLTIMWAHDIQAQDGVLMNCDRFDGKNTFQIYVDQTAGYILYNAQVRDSYERQRVYTLIGDKDDETRTVDEGLDISVNTEHVLQANNKDSTFIIVKATGTFAYAWVTLMPSNAGLVPFGMYHEGKCYASPFAKPE